MKNRQIPSTLLAVLAAFSISANAQVNMSFVTVANPGNTADPATGLGSVGYTYDMGTYDVTLTQYCSFLNAVAATSDPYNLYNPGLATDTNVAGISFVSGSYSLLGDGQRPVTFITWFDAARFCNWLSNGQPKGTEGNGTTETGAYTLSGTVTGGIGISKNANAKYWIPTEAEWYKAAYYDPSLNGGSGGYWLYPTRSNTVPGNSWANRTSPNEANYYNGVSNTLSGSTGYLTPVGAFTNSASAYGTYDQGGDVFQWNDTTFGSSFRGVRTASWYGNLGSYAPSLASTKPETSNYTYPTIADETQGFRIATVPEPSCFMLMGLGVAALATLRRKTTHN